MVSSELHLGGRYLQIPMFIPSTDTEYGDLNDIDRTCTVQAKDTTLNKPVIPGANNTYWQVVTFACIHYRFQIASEITRSRCFTRNWLIDSGWYNWVEWAKKEA